jgi:GAF domain-containing protein
LSGTANKAPPVREPVLTTEEAGLRHMAMLVARGAPRAEIFDAVAEQVARIFGRPWVGVMRYDSAETFVVVATWGGHPFPVGSRWPLDGPSPFEAVLRTGRPAAVVDYTGLPGTVAQAARQAGIVGAIAAPIVVDGATWGVVAVPATREAPIPAGLETRLIVFTELVASAIANGEARDALARLADEQAALRRVATLVARESSPMEIFAAVTEEACRVLASEAVGLLRFDPDETATLLAQSDTPWDPPPVGTRFTLDGENVVAQVFCTGATVRVDDWTGSTGAIAAMASVLGVRSAVASPVVVEGRLWGTIIAATSQGEPLPAATESRLVQFTGLVATAIANAGARGELSRLAEEQAALRRVAVLVAQQPSPVEVFAAVTEAVGPLLGADLAAMHVYRGDGVATVVSSWSETSLTLPIGTELPLEGDSAVARIFRTGAAARIDGYADVEGETAEVARGLRLRTAVGAPILVDGKLWGALMAATRGEEPLPEDAEARIAAFTELVATAVSNAQAREELRALAEEQAALRRVAVLVAQEASPTEVFTAVAVEVGLLLGVDVVNIVRHDRDETATAVASWSAIGGTIPLGSRLPLGGPSIMGSVARTGRPARIDSYDVVPGAVTYVVEGVAIRAGVGAPIAVEGRVWGTVIALSASGEPLPADTEARLSAFTELMGVAIADTHAREELRALADEQAALRRVAELVAKEAALADVLVGVAEEVAKVLGDVEWALARDDGDGMATVLAVSDHNPTPVDARVPIDARTAFGRAIKEGRPARVDDYFATAGDFGRIARKHGVRAAVSCPILVRGRTWGAMSVGWRNPDPFPPETESVVARFSDLVATAVANAEARAQVERLADEQAALRRIATLVARGAAPEQVFAAVTEEIAATFDAITAVMRYELDPPGEVMVGLSEEVGIPIGTRWPLGEGMLSTEVYRTGRSVRMDALSSIRRAVARLDAARRDVQVEGFRFGVPSQVACPIVVEGSLWGVITLNGERELPSDTEQRLENFTELVTTAIANAEAGIALRAAAEEQAALRRVATLVAAAAAPSEVFAAVISEIALVLGADACMLCRADPDGAAVVVGTWADGSPEPDIGTRIPRGGTNLVTIVLDSGRPARMDSYDEATGPASEVAHTHSLRSAVGAPILVDGRLWGLVVAGTTRDQLLPPNAEERLAGFTKLVATAISNAQAQSDLTSLAEQQAALRRVATLVARRVAPEVVFRAVAEEAGGLLGADLSALVRLESDDTVTVMAGPPPGPFAAGERVAIDPGFVVHAVRETGRPARFEADDPSAEGMPELVRRLGLRSAVASPIAAEGAIWGAVIVGSFGASFPSETEQRLDEFTELAATAISNATARAELVASRARIVAAGDEARRRIERNLHDGTQQRLIALGLDLQRARAAIPDGQGETESVLVGAEQDLEAILADLRELSHGLHPPLLSRLGLGPSLQALARRSPIPVRLEVDLAERPAASLETAVYYVVSEALTNAIKHSHASEISVTITSGEKLEASIVDDGVGDADPGNGSGLTGLLDRVDALGGRFALDSPPRGGTRISIELPVEPTVAP